jgi:hypothetical protein
MEWPDLPAISGAAPGARRSVERKIGGTGNVILGKNPHRDAGNAGCTSEYLLAGFGLRAAV